MSDIQLSVPTMSPASLVCIAVVAEHDEYRQYRDAEEYAWLNVIQLRSLKVLLRRRDAV